MLLGLGLAYFGAYQLFKLPVVLPVLLADYGYDRTLAGAFVSIYALAGLLLSVWLGRLVTDRGPLSVAAPAVALMGLGSILSLCLPHHGLLVLAGRALEGAAFAALGIIGPVLASKHASPRQVPLVLGLCAAWIPAGQLAAALLAPLSLASAAGWRGLWLVAMTASVLFFLWCRRFARRTGRANPPGGGHREGTPTSRMQKVALVLTGGVFMLWSGQYFAYMTWLPQYLVEVHGMEVDGALAGYVLPVLFVAVFNVTTGLVLRAGWPVGWVMTAALATQALVWWLIPYTGAGLPGVASLVAYGIGAGVVPACLFALPGAILGPGHDIAGAFGFIMTGRNMGVLVGPVLLAHTFKLTGGWELAAALFAVFTTACLGIGIVLAMILHRRDGPPPK